MARIAASAILAGLLLGAGVLVACEGVIGEHAKLDIASGIGANPALPDPHPTLFPTVKIAKVVGWQDGATPIAAKGLTITALARNLTHPRWIYVLPNGDILVALTEGPHFPGDAVGIKGKIASLVMTRAGAGGDSANLIVLLRQTKDGVQQFDFLSGLFSPFGMALVGDDFYVANTDAVMHFKYHTGDTSITTPGTKLTDLPGGPIDHHWTKNLLASKDGTKLFVSVGSNSNVADNGFAAEARRAAIWEVDRATGTHRIFASGLPLAHSGRP